MIKNIYYICTQGTNPYENLALEEYLLNTVPKESCILYLWQNKHTVVIGKNQNPWQECKVASIQDDGGFLARRLSGGGAVFHDMGNLNFTFIMPAEEYDIDKQLLVISKAVQSFGLETEKSGRNDLTIDGKKFSGNAFCKQSNAYHHGTIMVDADLANMSKYLNVSLKKLESNGVSSVRSRVANLKEFSPEINIPLLKERLVDAFAGVYCCPAQPLSEGFIDNEKIEQLKEKYSSWDWIFGKKLNFNLEIDNRFPWGAVTLQLCINNGVINDAAVFSDAMDCQLVAEMSEVLKGCRFDKPSMAEAFKGLLHNEADKVFEGFNPAKQSRQVVASDLSDWIMSLDL